MQSQLRYLRETFCRHALEDLKPAIAEKNEKKWVLLRKRLTVNGLFEGPWLVDTHFSPLAPALGPPLKTGYVTLFRCSWRSA